MAEVVDKRSVSSVHRSNKNGRKALKENGLGDWGILMGRGLKLAYVSEQLLICLEA